MRNIKLQYWILLVVVLIVFAIVGKKAGWFGGQPKIEVSTEKVKRRTIAEKVSANGKIQPEVEVKISPDVSGEIIELLVKEGDKVNKGDLLVKINPDLYIAMEDRMEATLNSSKANYENAKARLTQIMAKFESDSLSYNRKVQLWEENVISKEEFEAIEATYKGSKADVQASMQNVRAALYSVKSTEASLKEAKDNLTKTSIFAPVSGTISALMVEKGERVVGTSQFAGTEIMKIANLNSMEVDVEVNENDIIKVHLGDTAEIEIDAYLDRKFKGIVTETANSAITTGTQADQVTNFSVKIRILQESYKDLLKNYAEHLSPFRPGMSATVDIKTGIAENILSIPIQAVTVRDDTSSSKGMMLGKKESQAESDDAEQNEAATNISEAKKTFECVFGLNKQEAKLIIVTTGMQDQDYIEIKEGLMEGQEIIVAPYQAISKKLENGSKIKKVDKDKLFGQE